MSEEAEAYNIGRFEFQGRQLPTSLGRLERCPVCGHRSPQVQYHFAIKHGTARDWRRMLYKEIMRRTLERRISRLKVETQRLRRAHRRERERAEQAISFLRVYRMQPGMDWPDVAAFLDADGPF